MRNVPYQRWYSTNVTGIYSAAFRRRFSLVTLKYCSIDRLLMSSQRVEPREQEHHMRRHTHVRAHVSARGTNVGTLRPVSCVGVWFEPPTHPPDQHPRRLPPSSTLAASVHYPKAGSACCHVAKPLPTVTNPQPLLTVTNRCQPLVPIVGTDRWYL